MTQFLTGEYALQCAVLALLMIDAMRFCDGRPSVSDCTKLPIQDVGSYRQHESSQRSCRL